MYSCVVRNDIVQGTVRNQYAVHSFATGLGTTDADATRDWITTNLLGVTDFSKELASNMTTLVRSRYAIDDRMKKAYYINPGHKWVAPAGSTYQSLLKLSDKMIAVAVVVLMDGQGNQVRRRLLSTVSSSGDESELSLSHRRDLLQVAAPTPAPTATVKLVPYEEKLAESLAAISEVPSTSSLPTLDFAVNIPQTLTEILGIPPDKPRGGLNITLRARFGATTSVAQIAETIGARVKSNFATFCPTCDSAYTTSVSLRQVPGSAAASAKRRLLQGETVDYEGTANVVLAFKKEQDNVVTVSEIFRSLFDTSYSTAWTDALQNDVPMQQFMDSMQEQQIVVQSASATWVANTDQSFVYRDIFALGPDAKDPGAAWEAETSGNYTDIPVATPAPPPGPPAPPPPPAIDEFDLLLRNERFTSDAPRGIQRSSFHMQIVAAFFVLFVAIAA